ncbi:MAG: RES domain-containing protein, partial [Mycobacteriales bacterium]
MIFYRHADPRYPFLWETADQPAARWHGNGDGPVHYLADTTDGAWAEFLRHEAITEVEDLAGVECSLWTVDVPDEMETDIAKVDFPGCRGGLDSYPLCRQVADDVRSEGRAGLIAPSAALVEGAAHGWHVDDGLQEGPSRDGRVLVLFGRRA